MAGSSRTWAAKKRIIFSGYDPRIKNRLICDFNGLKSHNDSAVDKCEGADVALQKREILGLDVLEIQYII